MRPRTKRRRLIRYLLEGSALHIVLSAFAVAALGTLGIFTAWAVVVSVPSISSFENRKVAESTKIYDRTGNVLLYDVHGSMRRTAVPLADISVFVRNATVAIEDAEFYQHIGFRPLAFIRAALVNVATGSYSQGGSTITQQVVKNTLLTQDKTIIRKAKEIVLALKLERVASKDRILEIYLNENPYGGTIYGVEEASQYFFGKHAKDVTLAEAAYLAALPQAPTRYSPYGNHRDELERRKNLVLSRMRELNFITEEEVAAATEEQVVFRDEREAGIKAPHFVFFVREYLEEKYGADAVANGGLQVITTLDWDLQQKAEEIVTRKALENKKVFDAENAGLVAIDPKTGHVLAMVGSRGYFDEEIDGKVNITTSKRQPGSSFKPFVYATALARGYTPETVVFDLKTQFSTACRPDDFSKESPCFSPDNYDDSFRGPMTLRNALAQSVNVPAVKVLYLVGIQNAIETAERMGITTLAEAGRYGLTLVLGGGEVTLLELTDAYGAFANDGVRNPATPILRVEDPRDKTLEEYVDNSSRVLDAEVARTMNDMLSDNTARTPAFGAASPLFFANADVAAKTGTTNDYRDVWIVGYSTAIAAGAWAGNNDNSPIDRRVASFVVAPLWREFMDYAIPKYPGAEFTPPAPDPDLDSLPPVLRGNWNPDPSLGIHDILFWVNKENPRASRPTNPSADSQYYHWEYPVSLWSASGGFSSSGPVQPIIQQFAIASPAHGERVRAGTSVALAVEYLSSLHPARVSYYLNGALAGTSTQAPFSLSLTSLQKGPVTLRAVAEGPYGSAEDTVTFIVE